MLFFYNKKMLGETLLITINDSENVTYEYKKNITLIKDENDHLVGLNIFNVENLKLQGEGSIEFTEEQKEVLEKRLEKNGIKIDLEGNNDDYFVVGEVLTCEKHPDADKLKVTTVKVSEDEVLQIVCGAPNVEAGQKVVVSLIGAMMPSGLLIKKSKLRGVESNGMLCSKRELGLPQEEVRGILVLENDVEVGTKFKDLNLKQYIKDLIKGEAKLTDLINIQSLKNLILQQLSASLKVIIMIIVLALLSSILKSLESSFSSGEVTKIVNYIIFITMVTLVLVNFKDVLSIAYTTVNSIISIVNILIPILLSLMVVGGLTATSATLSPVFVGGVSVINLVFKNIIFTLITLAFCVLVVNNLSKNIKLKRFSELLKKANIVIVGAVFIIYLGLISIQGIYVTSFDKFTVKSAKFAVGSFIPVIGNFVSDSVDILLSSSLLIKNIFGSIGLILLIGICLVPIIKIFSIIIVYKIGAAIVEPIGEDNISSFMDETSKLMTVILVSVLAVLIMFFITISILTSLSIAS